MKKFLLSTFSLLILIVTAVMMSLNIGGIKATALFEDMLRDEQSFENSAILSTLAPDNTLVAVDNKGNFYKSGTESLALIKKGEGLKISLVYDHLTDGLPVKYGLNKLIAAGNEKIVVVGQGDFTGESRDSASVYISTDNGLTYKEKVFTYKAPFTSKNENIGVPVSIVYGNGIFMLETLTKGSDGNINDAKYYYSSDAETWQLSASGTADDYNLSFSNGYFFRTEKSSKLDTEARRKISILFSQNGSSWKKFASPINYEMADSEVKPLVLSMGWFNNAFYVFGYDKAFCTTSLSADMTLTNTIDTHGWTEGVYKVEPYQNGALFFKEDGVFYCDIGQDGLSNKTEVYKTPTQGTAVHYPNAFAQTGDLMMLGCSNFWDAGHSSSSRAHLQLYKKAEQHTVTFNDWNGAQISQVKVLHGQVAVPPTNPSRDGYNFVGWSAGYDQPIYEDMTFTAQYQPKQFQIRFVDWDDRQLKEITKEYGSFLEPEDYPTNPSRDGYTFIGWDVDAEQPIISAMTIKAKYSSKVTLTINFPQQNGTLGLLNQFKKMEMQTFTIKFDIGEKLLENENYLDFLSIYVNPLINDFNDGHYDYDCKFISWDNELPEKIIEDTTITANIEKLNLVRLVYYSQLRFNVEKNYYYCFIGQMNVERMVQSGTIINLDDFKNPNVDYEVYNNGRNIFYDNLRGFKFLSWSEDISAPITQDKIITAAYEMPSVHLMLYDAEDFLFKEDNQLISFATIEDIEALKTATSSWNTFCQMVTDFFLFRWGDLGRDVAGKIDFNNFVDDVSKFHTKETRILIPFISFNLNYPDIYDGIFGAASAEITTNGVLYYYQGSKAANDLTYWINPIVFSSELYSLNVNVKYGTAIDSAIKTVEKGISVIGQVFKDIWEFIVGIFKVLLDYWWLVLIFVLLIIFRKQIVALFAWIFKSVGNLFKGAANKKRKAEKELSATKKNKGGGKR